jgi:tetratricopeptide (TPR) repeat protein
MYDFSQNLILQKVQKLIEEGSTQESFEILKENVSSFSPNDRYRAFLYLGDLTLDPEWYHGSFHIYTRRQPLLKLSEYYMNKKEYLKAVCFAKASLEIDHQDDFSDELEDYTDKAHWLLYFNYWYIGKKDDSKIHYDICYGYHELENMPDKYLNDYRFYYDLPTITINGECSVTDLIYPVENLIKDGDYIIESTDITQKKDLMIEVIKLKTNKLSRLVLNNGNK